MNDNINKSKILLVTSIVIAIYFLSMILLDYANIENNSIGVIRRLLLIPFFLMLLILPMIVLLEFRNHKFKKPKTLKYAGIISISTLISIFIASFS
jgi:hypothetical protein